MVLYFDDELRNGFSLRVSRYPEKNVTWVWCHIVQDGVLYAYSEPRLPCAANKIDPDCASAGYDVPQARVSFRRTGTSRDLKSLSFSAHLHAHRGEGGVDGPGDVPIVLEGAFKPGALRSGSPTGRFERTGRFDAIVQVKDKAVALSGFGKAHEQTQTRPRFGGAFTYAMLWGPTASLVALRAKERKYGNYEARGEDHPVSSFSIEPWSPNRAFAAVLDNGEQITGTAATIYKYRIPVFSRFWHGHVVAANVAGHRMVGMINDWRSEDQSYGLT